MTRAKAKAASAGACGDDFTEGCSYATGGERRRSNSSVSVSFDSIPCSRSFYAPSHIIFAAYPPLSLLVHALPDEVHLPPCAAAHEALPDRCIELQRCAMVGRRRRGSSSTTPALPTTKSSDVANSSADAPADASNATYHHRRFNPATSYNDVRKEELAGGRPSVREEEIASRGRSRNIA